MSQFLFWNRALDRHVNCRYYYIASNCSGNATGKLIFHTNNIEIHFLSKHKIIFDHKIFIKNPFHQDYMVLVFNLFLHILLISIVSANTICVLLVLLLLLLRFVIYRIHHISTITSGDRQTNKSAQRIFISLVPFTHIFSFIISLSLSLFVEWIL